MLRSPLLRRYPGGPLFDPFSMAVEFDRPEVETLKEKELANGEGPWSLAASPVPKGPVQPVKIRRHWRWASHGGSPPGPHSNVRGMVTLFFPWANLISTSQVATAAAVGVGCGTVWGTAGHAFEDELLASFRSLCCRSAGHGGGCGVLCAGGSHREGAV